MHRRSLPFPALDLTRFAGTWYEIARLPDKAEKHCVRDAVVLYALADKPHRLQVVNSCVTRDGSTEIRNASARTANKKVADGRLKVSSTFPFSTKQWVPLCGRGVSVGDRRKPQP